MFFTKEKNFYKFKYSNVENYNIHLFFDKDSINFYFIYYDEDNKAYFSKILYSFDIEHTTDDNISILENLYFYLTHSSSQLEYNIEFSSNELNNDYIKHFDKIQKSFFPKENNTIKVIFLSFIFELYHCDTFRDSKYYNKLKNNRVFKLFGAKLQYLLAKEMSNEKKLDARDYLKRKEKKWINILFSKRNKTIIEYATGYDLILSPERELEFILDKSRIKELDIKKDRDLIELSSKYFLSVFNIPKVFDIITKNNSSIILLIMSSSFILLICSLFIYNSQQYIQGFMVFISPIIIGFMTIYILFRYGVSYLSILIMPRLFFSILISWLALLTSYDLFFAHIHHNFSYFWILNAIILGIIVIYFYIKIGYNRFKRISSILIVSMFISLIQGIFISKFYLHSFINRAFTNENYINTLDISSKLIDKYKYKDILEMNSTSSKFELVLGLPKESIISLPKLDIPYHDFFIIDVYILFGLIMLPIFFGLILQNIMDDKSVFKPLK